MESRSIKGGDRGVRIRRNGGDITEKSLSSPSSLAIKPSLSMLDCQRSIKGRGGAGGKYDFSLFLFFS